MKIMLVCRDKLFYYYKNEKNTLKLGDKFRYVNKNFTATFKIIDIENYFNDLGTTKFKLQDVNNKQMIWIDSLYSFLDSLVSGQYVQLTKEVFYG